MSDRARLEAALPELQDLLAAAPLNLVGQLEIERQFDAGQSNPTYLLRAGDRQVVLRKQPYGKLLPKAHDVLREYRIMQALAASGFPVPRPRLAGDAGGALGTAYFIMDYVPGVVESDPALPDRSAAERTAIYRAMADQLADLHQVPPAVLEAAGVAARPDFLGRQIAIWQSHYTSAAVEPEPLIESVARWLRDQRPAPSRAAIVHGDFRVENIIFRGTDVAAVLDWELCAIGEPLCDLAYCCLWYHLPHAALGGLADVPRAGLGIPEQSEFIAAYCARAGCTAEGMNYFMAFAFYRLAAILQGVYRRALDGNAASPQAFTRGGIARLCLERAAMFAAEGARP